MAKAHAAGAVPSAPSARKTVYLSSVPPKPGELSAAYRRTSRYRVRGLLWRRTIAAEIKCVEMEHALDNGRINVWIRFRSLKEAAGSKSIRAPG